MQKSLRQIQKLIASREIKKAEVQIARWLRAISTSDDDYPELLRARAQVRLLASRPEEALHDLQKACNLRPEWKQQPATLEMLADSYLSRYENATVGFAQKSDVREANELYDRLLREFPDYENQGWIYYQKGRACLIDDRAYAAETFFHKALFAPSTVSTLTAYCYERLAFIAYYEARQHKQALVYLNKAIDTYPASEPRLWLVQVYLLRSRVLREMDLSAAQASAEQALQISSENASNRALLAEPLFAVAEILADQPGREQAVIEFLQRFTQTAKAPLGVDVTWSRVYEMMGDAYLKLKAYEEAIAAYQNALQYNPYHPWEETVYYRIGHAYYQLQRYEEAIATLEALTENEEPITDYRVYNLLGNAFFALADYDKAAAAYEQGIALAPASADTERMQAYYELSQQMNLPL